MKKIILTAIALVFSLGFINAQDREMPKSETCLFAQRDTCDLYLDIFRPSEGSETTFEGRAKPTIMYAFGGGFIMGSRVDDWTLEWFKLLNENGYTVVTIDYRLGMKGQKVGKGLKGTFQASELFYNAQQIGVEDVFSAVSFIDENKEELGIDPSNMVLSGSSAGAIIALASEFDIARGRTEGLPEGFNFRGVMSFAGAIISLEGTPTFKNVPCPILLFHGMKDKAVAYNNLSFFGKGLWGSVPMDRNLDKLKAPHRFYRIKNRTHDVAAYMIPMWEYEKEFLEQDVILGKGSIVDIVVDDPNLPQWTDITLDKIYK